MKKLVIFFFCLLAVSSLSAQVATDAMNQKDLTLRERFTIMKTKSQSYNDYKVIKEFLLDGVWKIVQDSIQKDKAKIHEENITIARLEGEVKQVKDSMKMKDESVAGIVFDSTHIKVLGMNLNKSGFITFVTVVVIALLVLLGVFFARMKLMHTNMKEKVESLNILNKEYDDFKHKALDKQTKLSRELQNERNKLQELRPH
jgi:hypothetical protein